MVATDHAAASQVFYTEGTSGCMVATDHTAITPILYNTHKSYIFPPSQSERTLY
jgi:hypothetical protein